MGKPGAQIDRRRGAGLAQQVLGPGKGHGKLARLLRVIAAQV